MSASAAQPGAVDGAIRHKPESLVRKATENPPQNDMCCIFVHAGAGYHSHANEKIHLNACNDAAQLAMMVLRNGGSALDAAEMAVKILEDREITNAGYGSNLAMDGVVECDASIVDHNGRSGAVGAVYNIKNPITLARLVLNHTTEPLTLRRVPPNLLVAQGALEFAREMGMPELPHDALVSPAAKERWLRWKSDLKSAERKARKSSLHPSCWRIRSSASAAEQREHERIRREHTNNMLQGFPMLAQTPSPIPTGDLFSYAVDQMSHSGLSRPPSSASIESIWTENLMKRHDSEELELCQEPTVVRPMSVEESSRNAFINSTQKVPTLSQYRDQRSSHTATLSQIGEGQTIRSSANDGSCGRRSWGDGSGEGSGSTPAAATNGQPLDSSTPPSNGNRTQGCLSHEMPVMNLSSLVPESQIDKEDHITDTVGAIAVDSWGNIACAASSGGIGMKYRGRVGPAALIGVGAAVVPVDPDDPDRTCVGTVASGTGEHMATTMAATVCAERLYQSLRKKKGGEYEDVTEDEALRSMIEKDFMGHPSVKNSNSAGAIGVLGIKKSRSGMMLFFGHNTDSFAIASMHSDDKVPWCAMSRSNGNGKIAQGGRLLRLSSRKKKAKTDWVQLPEGCSPTGA